MLTYDTLKSITSLPAAVRDAAIAGVADEVNALIADLKEGEGEC